MAQKTHVPKPEEVSVKTRDTGHASARLPAERGEASTRTHTPRRPVQARVPPTVWTGAVRVAGGCGAAQDWRWDGRPRSPPPSGAAS